MQYCSIAVLESKELKKGKTIGVTRMGEKLVFWRDSDGQVGCLWDKCAHRGVALSIGKVIDGEIQCPVHGLQYDKNGRCTVTPSRGYSTPVPKNFKGNQYPARDITEEHPEIPFFDNIDETFDYATHICRWVKIPGLKKRNNPVHD